MKTNQIFRLSAIALLLFSGCKNGSFDPLTNHLSSAAEVSGTANKATIKQFIKPENFVSTVTNPYFPLVTEDTLYYVTASLEEGDTIFETNYVTATSDIKMVQGIACKVVHDVVTEDGVITEDTYDWHAQDIYGNVWYFGEDTKALQEDGTWSTLGSWESGVDGAIAGIIMPGDPDKYLGQIYRQEQYPGYAQDKGKIVGTNETVTIGLGTFTNCLKTEETTPLDPGVIEHKWYAPGIGTIKAKITVGGYEYSELIEIK